MAERSGYEDPVEEEQGGTQSSSRSLTWPET
jgi:hypothetical protein